MQQIHTVRVAPRLFWYVICNYLLKSPLRSAKTNLKATSIQRNRWFFLFSPPGRGENEVSLKRLSEELTHAVPRPKGRG